MNYTIAGDNDCPLIQIRLREDEQLVVCVRPVNVTGHPLVPSPDGLGGVNQERDHISVSKLSEGRLVELGAQGVLWLVEARGVNDDELRVVGVDDGAHATPRGLRYGARDGNLLTHAGVEQR